MSSLFPSLYKFLTVACTIIALPPRQSLFWQHQCSVACLCFPHWPWLLQWVRYCGIDEAKQIIDTTLAITFLISKRVWMIQEILKIWCNKITCVCGSGGGERKRREKRYCKTKQFYFQDFLWSWNILKSYSLKIYFHFCSHHLIKVLITDLSSWKVKQYVGLVAGLHHSQVPVLCLALAMGSQQPVQTKNKKF